MTEKNSYSPPISGGRQMSLGMPGTVPDSPAIGNKMRRLPPAVSPAVAAIPDVWRNALGLPGGQVRAGIQSDVAVIAAKAFKKRISWKPVNLERRKLLGGLAVVHPFTRDRISAGHMGQRS